MDFYRKRHMGLLLKHLAWIASCVVLLSCSSDEDDDFGDVGEKTRITVLMSLGGQGDNGYNDLITEGIMKVSNHQDVELSMIHPCDMDEARDIFHSWMQMPAEGRSLLLLVGDYKNCVLIRICRHWTTTNKFCFLRPERRTCLRVSWASSYSVTGQAI